MPKQLIATAPRTAMIAEYEDRPIHPHEVRIQTEYASPKHGTELVDFRGISPFEQERFDEERNLFVPREKGEGSGVPFGSWNLGNQFVGKIVEVGQEVQAFHKGDQVSAYGGIRETHILPAKNNSRLRKLPIDSPIPFSSLWKSALCHDPAQFALGGVRDCHIRPGDRVAVFGLGAIGLIAVQLCLKLGASYVAGIDPIEHRRQLAAHWGAFDVFDPVNRDVGLALKTCSENQGMDGIIETSGNPTALQQALRGLGYGGTISYVAFGKEIQGGVNFGKEAHFNNAKITFSRAASLPNSDHPRWDRERIENVCWHMLMTGFLDGSEIVHPILPFAESDEAYMYFVDKHPEESIKLGISFPGAPQ